MSLSFLAFAAFLALNGVSAQSAGSLTVYSDQACSQQVSANNFAAGGSYCLSFSIQGTAFSYSYACTSTGTGTLNTYTSGGCSGSSTGAVPFATGMCANGAPSTTGIANYVKLACGSGGGGSTTPAPTPAAQTVYVYSDASCSQQTVSFPLNGSNSCYGWNNTNSALIICKDKSSSQVSTYTGSASCMTEPVSAPSTYSQGACVPVGNAVAPKYVKVDCGNGISTGGAFQQTVQLAALCITIVAAVITIMNQNA